MACPTLASTILNVLSEPELRTRLESVLQQWNGIQAVSKRIRCRASQRVRRPMSIPGRYREACLNENRCRRARATAAPWQEAACCNPRVLSPPRASLRRDGRAAWPLDDRRLHDLAPGDDVVRHHRRQRGGREGLRRELFGRSPGAFGVSSEGLDCFEALFVTHTLLSGRRHRV